MLQRCGKQELCRRWQRCPCRLPHEGVRSRDIASGRRPPELPRAHARPATRRVPVHGTGFAQCANKASARWPRDSLEMAGEAYCVHRSITRPAKLPLISHQRYQNQITKRFIRRLLQPPRRHRSMCRILCPHRPPSLELRARLHFWVRSFLYT